MKRVGRVSSGVLKADFVGMQMPTPRVISDNQVQVYFATKVLGRSHVGYCVIEYIEHAGEFKIVDLFNRFCLEPGPVGTYSQDGVFPSSILDESGVISMYTVGWIEGRTKPLFSASIGLAQSVNGRDFTDDIGAPILDRSAHDPTLVTSPCVVRLGDQSYEMFYTSGTEWVTSGSGDYESRYHLKKCYSKDGTNWVRSGEVVLDYWGSVTNVARPAFVDLGGENKMLFSFNDSKLKKYGLGIASMLNGSWKVDDTAPELGDFNRDDCAAYPAVFSLHGKNYLLINGVDRGKSGFSVYKIG